MDGGCGQRKENDQDDGPAREWLLRGGSTQSVLMWYLVRSDLGPLPPITIGLWPPIVDVLVQWLAPIESMHHVKKYSSINYRLISWRFPVCFVT